MRARPWRQSAAWLVFLGPFFFASYGLANWLASLRPHVPAIVFEWERQIPFLAWTIVPYWLIDALYAISLFLCATHAQLTTHARRLITAQVVAVACFVLFPLRYSFERPEVGGVFGGMFAVLASFDQPFNQAPSLHIALLVILWSAYLRALPRAWHWPLHATLSLIGVSVLTTWQHHFIDVPAGAWLGCLCLWLHPEGGRSPLAAGQWRGDPKRRTIALRYSFAALTLAVVALAAGGAWLWLLWACGSLLLVAAIYAFGTEAAFQKRIDGSIAPAALGLLGPYFLGAWLNSRWWTRNQRRADPIVSGLLLGRVPTRNEAAVLGLGAIVDVSAELPCTARAARYSNVPMLDLVVPSHAQIERAALMIVEARSHGTVLVCCALGFSRSALAVSAWLLRVGLCASADEAASRVRAARPDIVLDPSHMTALHDWHCNRAGAEVR
jgi:protein-tyrosine phosphatase/membrane-associated phospholipid phosphatase